MIYFDNAATTNKKPRSVRRAVADSIKRFSANPGRSSHGLSIAASESLYEARDTVARFFGISEPEKIVFTYNATYALNMAIRALIAPNSHVIISNMEHNSVLRPICALRDEQGISYSTFNLRANNAFKEIESRITPETKAIICTAASNVTGDHVSLLALSEVKKKYGIKLIVDSSQLAGHKPINLSAYDVDAFIAPAHKGLLGIMGAGFCIFKSKERLGTFISGGSGVESRNTFMPQLLPEAYEAGTLGLPAIMGLKAGLDYITSCGIYNIEGRINALTDELKARLTSLKGVEILGASNGIISFNFKDYGSEYLALILDKKGFCTRGGLHCAPLAHESIGTLERGALRVSLSHYNTISEIDKLYRCLKSDI